MCAAHWLTYTCHMYLYGSNRVCVCIYGQFIFLQDMHFVIVSNFIVHAHTVPDIYYMYTLFCIRMSEQRACYHIYVLHRHTDMLISFHKDAMYAILTQTIRIRCILFVLLLLLFLFFCSYCVCDV